MTVRVQLRRDAHRAARSGAAWLTRRQIAKVQGPPDPAALAQVVDARGRALGWGLYSPESKLLVRMLSWHPEALRPSWLHDRLALALQARAKLGLETQGTTGYREVNSEGDGLPGLTVDRYGTHRVLALTTAPMVARAASIREALARLAPLEAITLRPATAAKREGFEAGMDGLPPDALRYLEYGLPISAPPPPTQKTGAYHDQRENRRRVAELAGRDGRPLLDLGCHVGGFSLHAAREGVDCVAVDQSRLALSYVETNAAALRELEPDVGRIRTLRADIFAPLQGPALEGPFGTVVFDPPKVATSPRDLPKAVDAMRRSLRSIEARLGEGALLIVCSCSHHLDADRLDEVVLGALTRAVHPAGRFGPGPDHPVADGHRRGEYLRVNHYRVS